MTDIDRKTLREDIRWVRDHQLEYLPTLCGIHAFILFAEHTGALYETVPTLEEIENELAQEMSDDGNLRAQMAVDQVSFAGCG